MLNNTHIEPHCYHCGEGCEGDSILFEEKNFCCDGCVLVYNILNDNNLCDYYKYAESPGTTGKGQIKTEEFAYLDLDEVKVRLLSFESDKLHQITLFIPSIHCSSCIWLLENLNKLDTGVLSSRVNFVKKEVSVSYNPQETSLRKVVELLSRVGYEPAINLSQTEQPEKVKSKDRSLYIKLGVAGFCFGNIMLLSLPEYFSIGNFIEQNLRSFFGYLNIALSLPTLLYSATEYLVPAWRGLKHKQIGIDVPISIGILALFFTSVAEIFIGSGAGYMDSLSGLIFFLLLGKVFQKKTYGFLSFERDFKSYFPISIQKLVNGQEYPIMVNEIQQDDVIVVRNGDLIPVDATITRGNALIDYSFITGESVPVPKFKGEKVFAGGKQTGGELQLNVLKSFSNSDITRLWDNEVFKSDYKSEFNQLSNRISKYFTFAILLIAVGAALFWMPDHWSMSVKTFTSVLIVACPCALALASPFTQGSVLRIFSKNRFFLKNASTVEKMGAVNAIVLDKTGTLTDNKGSKITYTGLPLSNDQKVLINALTRQSNHPISKRISMFMNTSILELDSVTEIPGKGLIGTIGNDTIKIGSNKFILIPVQPETGDYNGTWVEINGQVLGAFKIEGNYREGVTDSLGNLANEYEMYILSGDDPTEERRLKSWLTWKKLLFGQTPQDKLNFVRNLQKSGDNVMMVGDGLNDAGALKASNVGIALSDNLSGFSPACDAILEANHIDQLPAYLRLTKSANTIIKISFVLSLLYNLVGLFFAVQGQLTPILSAILMPLSSISIVLFTTLAVQWKANSLGLTKVNEKEIHYSAEQINISNSVSIQTPKIRHEVI